MASPFFSQVSTFFARKDNTNDGGVGRNGSLLMEEE